MKKLALLLLLTIPALGQRATPENYSHGIWRGVHSLPVLSHDPRLTIFSLRSSWIPGPTHKGVFRYQITASISSEIEAKKTPAIAPPYGWDIPDAVQHLHACSYSLEILDEGGFILQRAPIVFTTIVNNDGQAVGLSANDYFPMDIAQYRSFLKARSDESWNIEWTCTQ